MHLDKIDGKSLDTYKLNLNMYIQKTCIRLKFIEIKINWLYDWKAKGLAFDVKNKQDYIF